MPPRWRPDKDPTKTSDERELIKLHRAAAEGQLSKVTKLLKATGVFKGGMTVKEINAAFGERAGELKKPAKRLGLIDMGLLHLFMM